MENCCTSTSLVDYEKLRESLECSVCANIFDDPKQLICGHTFCNACIQRLRIYEFDITKVTCPQCREISVLPEHGLKTNFIVKDMIMTLKELELKDLKNSVKCDYCDRQTKNGEIFFCRSCRNEKSNHSHGLLMCSVCAIKQHKGHDVDVCDDLATEETRVKCAQIVENAAQTVANTVDKMVYCESLVRTEMSQIFNPLCLKIYEYSKFFDSLQIECLNNCALKSDLSNCVQKAQEVKERLENISGEADNFYKKLIDDLHNIKTTVESILSRPVECVIKDENCLNFAVSNDSHAQITYATPLNYYCDSASLSPVATTSSNQNLFTLCDSTTTRPLPNRNRKNRLRKLTHV